MEGAGTVVQLPPTSTSATQKKAAATSGLDAANKMDAISNNSADEAPNLTQANVARRNTSRDERKRELLIEARKARIDWILDGVNEDAKDLKEALNGKKNPLRELQACAADGVTCAPEVVEALFSSKLEGDGDRNLISSKIAEEVKRIMENEQLSWENVSASTTSAFQSDKGKPAGETTIPGQSNIEQSTLLLPPVHSLHSYNAFLQILCQPEAADVVFSMQKFCKTIEEAARVILSMQHDEKQKEMNAKSEKEKSRLQQYQHPLNSEPHALSEESARGVISHVRFSTDEAASQKSVQAVTQPPKHAESLAKAVRGFTKTTFREMESHDAFKLSPQNNQEASDSMNEELMACLETFVFTKCHCPIYRVLGAEYEQIDHDDHVQSEAKSVDECELELQEKMKLLQFVTPEHLEIQCLKSAPDESIDLSDVIVHLLSIKQQSSPRQKLQAILLAYRGINVSLNAVLNSQRGDTPSPSPPSADDVLPTLILAVLRAQPEKIVADLRFIEFFATVNLLRGEAGYAYTNLCGAVQFLRKLDMEGHAAEVSLGEEGAHLSISPDDFRAGIEQCKQAMKVVQNKISTGFSDSEVECSHQGNTDFSLGDSSDQTLTYMKISGRDIREARSNGETVGIDWALRKQKDLMWQLGKVESVSTGQPNTFINRSSLPPEEPPLPAHFNRSYSYLATRPDDIRISDLPKLLNEYRMLVHATESLLNERSTWREAEKRKQMQLSRLSLERDFNEVIGQAFSTDAANGHGNKS
jgi:hypothetical protein